MRFFYTIILALGFHGSIVLADTADQTEPAAKPSLDCEEAITVFHDTSGFGRKDRAAAKMTERHKEMALSGWRFAGMQVYTENGDLEGFYVSYTRAVECAAG